MKNLLMLSALFTLQLVIAACDSTPHGEPHQHDAMHDAAQPDDMVKGPHGGRLLAEADFSLELAIFETGVPPQFRVWVSKGGAAVAPDAVDVSVTLTRLGDVNEVIVFTAQEDYLRGDTVIAEPHSFVVTIEARHGAAAYRWQYDSFEGRTRISPEMAQAFGLETAIAGAATLRETVTAYGQIVPNAEKVRHIDARFAGSIQSVAVAVGERVYKGQTLASVESNESLTRYTITAPIDGVVTERNAQPGEQTGNRALFTVMDTTSVWVELAVFLRDLPRIRPGATVRITLADGDISRTGSISYIGAIARADQSVIARVTLDNADASLLPGVFVSGEIVVAEYEVPLAVKRSGLQTFRDFTVVYAQIGDAYEVRMLELGRQDDAWVEVTGGLLPTTRYVTTNSYLVKADIEKSGAAHDH